jgi:hypothetical protein
MGLRDLYILRILQLDVYADLLQHLRKFLIKTREVVEIEREIFEERKQIRSLLNYIELEKFYVRN